MTIYFHLKFCCLILFFCGMGVSISSAQKIDKIKPADIDGYWTGTFTVDYGGGRRDVFPYHMSIKRTKNLIDGFSESTIEIDGKNYSAKAHIKGEMHENYLKCKELENFFEEKLPFPHHWVSFIKMELIIKRRSNNQLVLEGLYELGDGTFGRITLEKKPPRV